MSSQPVQELSLPYDPGQLSAEVARRRGQVRSRVTSLVITVVVLVVIYLWRRDQLAGAGFFAVYGLVLLVSLGWLGWVLLGWRRARRGLASIGAGVAVRMGPAGVQVAGLGAGWSEVARLGLVKPGPGRAPVLQLDLTDGRRAGVGMDQVDVFPGTLDSTARAFSGGRQGVDLAVLES